MSRCDVEGENDKNEVTSGKGGGERERMARGGRGGAVLDTTGRSEGISSLSNDDDITR